MQSRLGKIFVLTVDNPFNMYSQTTRNITIMVAPQYLESQSKPSEGYYVWAYTIRIHNEGPEIVTLKTRYWKITDAAGRVQEVRGEGVIGEQPTLAPGDSFEYTSGAPLTTPSGFMTGSYQMETDDGEPFNVEIPAFSLDGPQSGNSLH